MANELQTKLDAILEDKNTNLLPEHLKTGVTCLGVEGNMETGVDTSDATATANDIVQGVTAYGSSGKINGSLPELIDSEMDSNVTVVGQHPTGNVWIRQNMPVDIVLRTNGYINAEIPAEDLANTIGLTSDKILSGNTILGVEGTAEAGSSTTNGAKIFETVEEMNASTNNTEGDLAIVYKNTTSNSQADSVFRVVKFPNVVVLPEAYTAWGEELLYVPADDSGVFMEANGMLYGDGYSWDCYIDDRHIGISYESSDGITYTRTDGGEEIIDFGINIRYDNPDYWIDTLGYFMQISELYFGGVYQAKSVDLPNINKNISLSGANAEFYEIPDCITNYGKTCVVIPNVIETNGDIQKIISGTAYLSYLRGIAVMKQPSRNVLCFSAFDTDINTPTTHMYSKIEFDVSNDEPITSSVDYTAADLFASDYMFDVQSTVDWYGVDVLTTDVLIYYHQKLPANSFGIYTHTSDENKPSATSLTPEYKTMEYYKTAKFEIAPTQLSVIDADSIPVGTTVYAGNGIVEGMGSTGEDPGLN